MEIRYRFCLLNKEHYRMAEMDPHVLPLVSLPPFKKRGKLSEEIIMTAFNVLCWGRGRR